MYPISILSIYFIDFFLLCFLKKSSIQFFFTNFATVTCITHAFPCNSPNCFFFSLFSLSQVIPFAVASQKVQRRLLGGSPSNLDYQIARATPLHRLLFAHDFNCVLHLKTPLPHLPLVRTVYFFVFYLNYAQQKGIGEQEKQNRKH